MDRVEVIFAGIIFLILGIVMFPYMVSQAGSSFSTLFIPAGVIAIGFGLIVWGMKG